MNQLEVQATQQRLIALIAARLDSDPPSITEAVAQAMAELCLDAVILWRAGDQLSMNFIGEVELSVVELQRQIGERDGQIAAMGDEIERLKRL